MAAISNARRWARAFLLLPLMSPGIGHAQDDQEAPWPPTIEIETLAEDVRAEIQAAEAIARAAPDNPTKVGELGKVYFGYKFNAAAAACFVRAAGLDRQPFRWWYYAGLSYKRASLFEPAVDALGKALELREYPPAHVELANLLIELDRPRATKLFARAIQLDGTLAAAHAGLGRCASMDDREPEAIEHFRRAVQLEPKYGAAHYELAMLLRSTGRIDEATQHLRLYDANRAELTPTDPIKRKLRRTMRASSVMTRRIRVMWDIGRLAEAEALLENHYLDVNPNEEAVRNLLGHTYLRQEEFEKAIEQFELILKDHPGYVETRSNLATAFQRVGRRADAERVLREALEQHRDSGVVLHHLALVLAQAGKNDEGLVLFERAVAAQPAKTEYRSSYGRALVLAQRNEDAAAQFRIALDLNPSNIDDFEQLGNALAATGDMTGAQAAWKSAIALDPTRLDPILRLIDATLANGEYERAERTLRNALKNVPKSPDVVGKLAWLLATCPDKTRVKGPESVKLAETACRLTKNNTPKYLDILAAAYARVGRFDDSVRAQERAIQFATKTGKRGLLKSYRSRLTLYSSERAYTQP